MHISVVTRKTPGIRIIHQEFVSRAFSERDKTLPQETVSTGSPIPIKLRVDSAAMAFRIFITTINIMEETKLGVRCRHSTWKKPPPIHLEARMYSLFRICRTSVRTIFAMLVQLVMPITRERLRTLAFPRMACVRISIKRLGTLSSISVSRMKSASSHAGAMPLADPRITAIAVEIKVETKPINREIRPPYQIMENKSRPMVSVPNKNSLLGGVL